MGSDGIKFVASALEVSSTPELLNIDGIPIECENNASYLLEKLHSHPRLDTLFLTIVA